MIVHCLLFIVCCFIVYCLLSCSLYVVLLFIVHCLFWLFTAIIMFCSLFFVLLSSLFVVRFVADSDFYVALSMCCLLCVVLSLFLFILSTQGC